MFEAAKGKKKEAHKHEQLKAAAVFSFGSKSKIVTFNLHRIAAIVSCFLFLSISYFFDVHIAESFIYEIFGGKSVAKTAAASANISYLLLWQFFLFFLIFTFLSCIG